MKTCKEIEPLLTAYCLGDLNEVAARAVLEHMDHCERCRASVDSIEPTLELLRDALAAAPTETPTHLDADAHARIVAARRAGVDTATSHGASPMRPRRWLFNPHQRLALAAAAVLVCGFVLSMISLLPRGALKGTREAANLSRPEPADHEEDFAFKDERPEVLSSRVTADYAGSLATDGKRRSVENNALGERSDKPSPIPMGTPAPAAEPEMFEGPEVVKSPVILRQIDGSSASPAGDRLGGRVTDNRETPDADGDGLTARVARDDFDVTIDRPTSPTSGKEPGVRQTSADTGKMVKLEYSLPKPLFIGTPRTIKSANLEPPGRGRVHTARGVPADESVTPPADEPDTGQTISTTRAVDAIAQTGEKRKEETKKKVSAGEELSLGAKLAVANERTGRYQAGAGGERSNVDLLYEEGPVAAGTSAAEKQPPVAEAATSPRFKAFGVNPFVATATQPFSTFAIDVDTASYTLSRNYMLHGVLPPAEAVRTEEFVNFFDYAYPPPVQGTFKIYVEAAPSRFGHGLTLLKIGVKGRRLGREEKRPAVLTFLIDTSGSMDQPDRLGLVRKALAMLIERLDTNDRVAIVQYDSHARLVLEHTPASERAKILKAIDALQCSGSTNLEEGMLQAYGLAAANFVPGGENRVLLLSDGVANLGAVAAGDILDKIAAYRTQGIYCSVFGFGMGTYDDDMLEQLANKGNGAYAFIDSEAEARRIFVDDLAATLNTIASDVRIQVEFKPSRVARYRQLGYENRRLTKEQFRDDAVDAGEVGSGQSVTALYELEPSPTPGVAGKLDPLGIVRVRYRRTDTGAIEEIEQPITDTCLSGRFDDASPRFRLAACVAEFGELLRGSPFAAGSDYAAVANALRPVALELDLDSRVHELLDLVTGAGGMQRAE